MQLIFRTGDIVRLKTGKSPMKVYEVCDFSPRDAKRTVYHRLSHRISASGWYLRVGYLSAQGYSTQEMHTKWRRVEDFELVSSTQEEPEMPDIYKVIKEDRYGTMLTKNSKGDVVLEMKGENGKVETFPENEIEIVLPYTVQVALPNSSTGQHVAVKEGSLQVGDIVLVGKSGEFGRVMGINTKCRKPVPRSCIHKVLTERVD